MGGGEEMVTPSTFLRLVDASLAPESDLASLASEAAIELDKLLLREGSNVTAVEQLASLLSRSSESGGTNGEMPLLLAEPSAAVVIHRAIADARGVSSMTIADLVERAQEVARELDEVRREPESFRESRHDELRRMRSFCLALSRTASGYRESVLDRSPDHPFRR